MMESRQLEITVGAFILMGMLALLMLAMKVSNLGEFGGGDGYEVRAKFDNVGGLKVRSPVKMAGVQVGRVSAIGFDDKTYQAVATLRIDRRYDKLPLDTSAKIYTAGLLGEQYVSLEAGGEEEYLKEGDQITLTSNAVVLEQVIGQFLYSKAAGDDKSG
ncbi:MAG: outer membrane lipid asymmetry maintenance protein MlaD [Chromatiales bacterium]